MIKPQPKITVIMTVKNGAPFIAEAIDSLQAQSYTNWEGVIVDDGSTDKTYEIIASYRNSKITGISTGGVGRGRALNIALEHSDGKFIANLDADDLSHPQRLEMQIAQAKKYPEAAVISGESIIFYSSESVKWPQHTNYLSCRSLGYELLYRNCLNHSSVLMRRDFLEDVGGYNSNRKSQLDYELWLRFLKNGYLLKKGRNVVAAKRIHPDQFFENKKRIEYLKSNLRLQFRMINECGVPSWYKVPAISAFCYGLFPQTMRMNVRRIMNK